MSRVLAQSALAEFPFAAPELFTQKEKTMLSWALTFLVLALIAGVLGFGGIAGASVGIAKILFFVFIVLFIIGLIVPKLRPPS